MKFEFVDINSNTLVIDEKECLKRLQSHKDYYAGIVYVRTYGFLSDTTQFSKACRELQPALKILDDRCLCMPERHPKMFSSDMVLYSTGHCKPIDFNGGGLAFYNQVETYQIDSNLEYLGINEEALYKQTFAENKPFSTIPTGWLKQDTYLDSDTYLSNIEKTKKESLFHRKAINSIYSSLLPEYVQYPPEYNSWRFNIRVPQHLKEGILQTLFENGLFASSHYRSANKLFDQEIFLHSDELFATVINLFNDKYFSIEKAMKTVKIINSIL